MYLPLPQTKGGSFSVLQKFQVTFHQSGKRQFVFLHNLIRISEAGYVFPNRYPTETNCWAPLHERSLLKKKKECKNFYLGPAEKGTYANGDFAFMFSLVNRRGSYFCKTEQWKYSNEYLTSIRRRRSKYWWIFTNIYNYWAWGKWDKQEPSEKCQFCFFVSNCHASMNRDAQSADHMLNR